MVLGYIVTDQPISKDIYVSKKIKVISYDKYVETDTPTLLLGWEKVNELYPETSILNKKIRKDLYWTFSIKEKRGICENDIKEFILKLNEDFVKDVKFTNIDPIIYKINDINKLISKITKFSGSFAYLYLYKLYFYNNGVIYHIDLNQLEYIGMDKELFLDYVKNNFIMVKNDFDDINIDLKYIPYIHAKKNNIVRDIHD